MSVAVHPKDKIIVGGVNAAKEKILAGENSNIRVYKFGKEGLSPHRVFQAGASKNEQDYTVGRFSVTILGYKLLVLTILCI